MSLLADGILVWAGLALLGVGVYAATTRQRLDRLGLALFVAGLGVCLAACGLGDLAGTAQGERIARTALAVALAQAVVFLALSALSARRLRATHTEQLNRLRG